MGNLDEKTLQAIRGAASARAELALETWRALHAIPEPSLEEHKTTRYIADFLAARGIAFEPSSSTGTGGIAVVGEGEVTAILRADIDALEVEEATGLDCSSTTPGYMHACGHDVHTTALLVAADALASGVIPLKGKVVLLFQPAEERHGGMLRMLDAGLLDKYPARRCFALHVWPNLPTGKVGASPGPSMAGNDSVKLTVIGKGGHGAHPNECVDPIVTAAHIITALQTITSRRLNPTDSAVLSFGTIRGGSVLNAIPDTVELTGSLRWLTHEVRETIHSEIEKIAMNTAVAHGARCEVEITSGYPPLVNDDDAVGEMRDALSDLLGQESVQPGPRTMGAEDMSYLLERVPGCYMTVGVAKPDGSTKPLHNPGFYPDPDSLKVAVAAFLTAATAL